MITTITEDDLLEELAREFVTPLAPDEVTARRLANKKGISHNAAKKYLDSLVVAGRLVAVKRRTEDGHNVTAYIRK